MRSQFKLFFILIFSQVLAIDLALACGANTRTWQADAASTNWNSNNNWTPRNRPNAANENALIISDWFNPAWPGNNYTLGCLEIQSGTMTATNNQILTISGDYFRNLNPGSLILGGANTWEVVMQGTADQTFENVDEIPRLRINNANTVTLTESFSVRNRFLIDAGTGFVVIEGDLETQQTGAITIPAGSDVTLASGASWTLNGSLTVDGFLRLEPGASLMFANGSTLTVSATGSLDINGVGGNAASIRADNSSSTISVTIAGTIDAQYLIVENLDTAGVNVTGALTRFDNISINDIPSGGSGITFGAAASLTSGMDNVGFFDDGTAGPFTNVNASAYSGSDVDFANWSGIGDTGNENDPNGVVNWGTEAEAVLQIQNISGAGVPPATIAKGSASTQFATFAFSMSGTAAAATNVTSLTFTLDGSNINSDVSDIAVFNDTNGNCTYDGGVDILIGNYTPTGTPGTVTASLSGEINVVDSTQDCLHVFVSSATAATTGNTIGISLESTDDVTNDQDYALSDTTGPPVRPGVASITGTAVARWNGGFGTNMATAGNWTPNGVPGTATDCEVGNGYSNPIMNAAFNCLNTRFQNSGTVNWNNSANIWNVYGSWVVENGFTFQNSNNAVVNIRGASDQSVTLDDTTFPGQVTVNSGGVVTFEDSGVISGNLTISSGSVEIANGASLQVTGNITVNAGTTLDIEPGGELILGNGSSITVVSGGTLEMVGTAPLAASVRAINDGSSYTVTVNNGASIRAQYYDLRNLGGNGLTINATANIDATYHLQNGTYIYPGANNADLLRLFQEIPGDTLDGMTFESDGSGATGVNSILTNTGATADTLDMTNYSGDLSGVGTDDSTNYNVVWDSETNELRVVAVATAPASADQGDVVNMGSFGFQQLNAGAFNSTDITFIRITLTGTGSSSDVDSVTLFYDSTCSGTGGVSLGTKTFSGNPARANFTGLSGVTVEADPTTPPQRCVYVEYNLNALATNNATVGAQIQSSVHVTNSESYEFNSSFAPPVALGTTSIVGNTTQWTGTNSTDWYDAGNWSGGLPTQNLNCIINSATNNPLLNIGTATCKSVSIGNGTLNHTGGTLQIYGSLESTGTINSVGSTIRMIDDGATPTSQNIDISSPLANLEIDKTAGGSVNIQSDVTLNANLLIPAGQNFTLNITSNNDLILNGGLDIRSGVIEMAGASGLQIASGQSLLVQGGTFRTLGTNDAFPQSLANKAHITNTGGTGTWTFSATSGTVDLTGFYFDWLDANGLNFSGNVALSNLNGGQLRNLPTVAGVRGVQFNTTGSIPATASNFGWNWGPNNTPPAEGSSYFLGFSSGCGGQTIDFDQWFGDFWPYTTDTTGDHISATSCTILIDRSKSPVAITHLAAVPYDNKVIVEWETGNEWDHQGFNVYRSQSVDGSFTQVNEELIRNDIFSTSIHGTYAFIDEGVNNDTTYFYYLEDVSLLGERTLHGPLNATPSASLGDPMTVSAGTIVTNGDQESGDTTADPVNENIEITENVWVLAETDSYMRIRIDVPALSSEADPLNSSYDKVTISGYQPTTDVGLPELLQKTILIPVNTQSNVANWNEVSRVNDSNQVIAVTPAPDYVVSGDQYLPQWTINSDFYGTSAALPNDVILIEDVIEIDGHFFLPLLVRPLRYNPVSQVLEKINEITLDLYLEGTAPWTSIDSSIDPWSREGGIKLGYRQEGMYKVTYDELEAAGVVAPVAGHDFQDIHIKISGAEIGYVSDSSDSQFDSGDSLYFYGRTIRSDEDALTHVLIYFDNTNTSQFGSDRDVQPQTGPSTSFENFWTKNSYEENNLAVFNEPYTEETDHFVWSLIYGISGGLRGGLEIDIDLEELHPEGYVTLQLWVKSRVADNINTLHNLEVFVNSAENFAAEQDFQAVDGHVLTFQISADQFVPGRNRIRLETTGDNLIPGEYDMLYIDRMNVYHSQNWVVDDDEALILDRPTGEVTEVDGFSDSDLYFFDVSHPNELVQLTNFDVTDTALGKKVTWELPTDLNGRRLWMGHENQFKSVERFRLTHASDWKNTNNAADVIYVGHSDMLEQAKVLGSFRESQGYSVAYVELEDVFNEFGKGVANVNAIKDFVASTKNWLRSPDYFILLGDGTYDPKAYQNADSIYHFPVKYIMGSSFDYVSDHWFVSDDQGIPHATIARIPAKTPQQLATYIQKVLSYESGQSRPATSSSVTFVTDKPTYVGEDFESPIEDISALNTRKLENKVVNLRRTELTDSQLNQEIKNSFSNSSLIHYMGHGAEDMWADNSVFENDDALTLNNDKLPVVVAMNCLNAVYSDPSFDSLAEILVMKEQGGAIAFWGSTSFSPPSIQSVYQDAFYDNLIQENTSSVGEIVQLSKTQAGLATPFDEVLYSWTIIGDPLVRAQVTVSSAQRDSEPVDRTPAAVTESGSSGGGCSAGAFSGRDVNDRGSFDLFVAFLLEVLIFQILISQLVFRRRKQRK